VHAASYLLVCSCVLRFCGDTLHYCFKNNVVLLVEHIQHYPTMLAPSTSLAVTLTAPHAVASMRSYWAENSAIRFATSGLIGNAIFFGLDVAFLPIIIGASQKQCFIKASKTIATNAESISFFVAYLVDIFLQHFLNALLVFGLDTIATRDMYLSSLATAYTAYFGTLCGSTILQAYLLRFGISKTIAFWSTIALGSVVNYVVLNALAARAKSQSNGTRENQVRTTNGSDVRSKRLQVAMISTPKHFAFLGQSRLKSKSSD